MIQIKYKELFDLEFLHPYYLSGKCADFDIVPTMDCRLLLNSYGIRLIPTPNGAKLFAKVNTIGSNDFIKSPLPDGIKFSFKCILKKKIFENITQINLRKEKFQFYYFNNLINNISPASQPLLVADLANKVVTDQDLLTFVSNTFSYTHNDTNPSQNSELRFIDTGEIFSQGLSNHNNTFNYTYDLSRSPTGRAKFYVEGVEKKSIYVINAAEMTDVFGVIEIFHKTALPVEYQFQKVNNSVDRKFYKIAFTNRYTKWRYHITKKFNQAITSVTVGKTNGALIIFSPKAGFPAGQFVMESNEPLPLIEDPITGIKLSDQTNKVIVPNLPNPPVHLVTAEGTDIISDILITI